MEKQKYIIKIYKGKKLVVKREAVSLLIASAAEEVKEGSTHPKTVEMDIVGQASAWLGFLPQLGRFVADTIDSLLAEKATKGVVDGSSEG